MDANIKTKITKAIEEKKIPIKEVAKKLFMSENQLKLLLESWGVKIPRKRIFVAIPEREILMQMYAKLGNSSKLAKYYGVSIGTAIRWMKTRGIPLRKMGKMTKGEKVDYLEKHLGKLDSLGF